MSRRKIIFPPEFWDRPHTEQETNMNEEADNPNPQIVEAEVPGDTINGRRSSDSTTMRWVR
jgi:hypothetical protein